MAKLTVVNTGTTTITVRGITGEAGELRIQDTGRHRVVHPDGWGEVDVQVRMPCRHDSPLPVTLLLVVEDAEGRSHRIERAFSVGGSAWSEHTRYSCDFLQRRSVVEPD
jgi:hypothetical protein